MTDYAETLEKIRAIFPDCITLTLPDVAKVLKVKEGSVRSACSRKKLPFPIIKIDGLPILVRVDDLARAISDLPQLPHEYPTPRKGNKKPSWASKCFTVAFLNDFFAELDATRNKAKVDFVDSENELKKRLEADLGAMGLDCSTSAPVRTIRPL